MPNMMRIKLTLCLLFCLPLLAGCGLLEKYADEKIQKGDTKDHFDADAKLSREDYKTLAPYREADKNPTESDLAAAMAAPAIPKLSPLLVTPRPPRTPEEQMVSIAVTEDVPLKDVFVELARLANVDIEVDPTITGGIIFRAKDKPLGDVIRRICEATGLRYTLEDNVLKIQRDTPYMKHYTLDFLNITRSNDGGVNVSTNVLSGGAASSDSVNSGSKTNIKTSSQTDLWKSLEDAVKQIVDSSKPLASSDAPEVHPSFSSLNKEAGVLTLFGNHFQHERIAGYLDSLNKKTEQQVLIEAKIVEVTLDDKFSSGINWGSLSFKKGLDFDFKITPSIGGTTSAISLNATRPGSDTLEAALNFTEQFGTTRTLSSPRVHAINNQQAVLTFAKNQVYFELKIDRETNTTSTNNQQVLNVNSTIKTVPIGIIVVVQPSINDESGEITLNVRPTLSRVVGNASDPAVAYLTAQLQSQGGTGGIDLANLKNEIPIVEVREMDTIMKVRSGDVMVMGGMMETTNTNTDAGVPWFSSIPWVGNAFKSTDKQNSVKEMVILIKATIVPSSGRGSITKQDIVNYKKFTNDPRPLNF